MKYEVNTETPTFRSVNIVTDKYTGLLYIKKTLHMVGLVICHSFTST